MEFEFLHHHLKAEGLANFQVPVMFTFVEARFGAPVHLCNQE
jgi:hypothetical protein